MSLGWSQPQRMPLTSRSSFEARRQRGQASLEFIMVLGVIMTMFITLGVLVFNNYVKTEDLKIYISGQRLVNHVADNINTLNAVADGHSTNFVLPPNLYGLRMYTVNFFENESTMYIEGSAFTSGREIIYSAPVTTNRVHCLLSECIDRCNRSSDQTCLQVNDTVDVRIAKYMGGIYMLQTHNVIQDDLKQFVTPFLADADLNLDVPENFVLDSEGHRFNVVYIRRDTREDALSLVFAVNLSGGDEMMFDVQHWRGDLVDVTSNDGFPLNEFNLDAIPTGDFSQSGAWDVDGAEIKFRGGFSACIRPYPTHFPVPDWTFLSSDGNHITLEKNEVVCVAYP